MTMTRKDYELLARAFRDSAPVVGDPRQYTTQWRIDVESVTDAFRTTNPRFDKERFLRACGIED